MALADAVPNIQEWPKQWKRLPGESFTDDLYTKAVTLGSVGMFIVVLSLLAVASGFFKGFALDIVNFQLDIPFAGKAYIVPSFILVGTVGAILFGLSGDISQKTRELTKDDINWYILAGALTYIASVFLGGLSTVSFPPSIMASFILFAGMMMALYLWRVLMMDSEE